MPLLSLLSIKSSSGSEEGSGGQQMTPELLNKAQKLHDKNVENTIKNPMTSYFRSMNEVVAASVITDTQNDFHTPHFRIPGFRTPGAWLRVKNHAPDQQSLVLQIVSVVDGTSDRL